MISRARWVGIVSSAMLALAAPCLAAEMTGMAPGRGGVGGKIGGLSMVAAEDYSAGAQPRFEFTGNFRYVARPWLRLQISPAFAWNAYRNIEPVPFPDPNFPADQTKDRYLTLVAPLSTQAQLLFKRGSWHYHVGAGPGVYRVWVQNRRKVLQDPVTNRRHRGLYLGGSGEFGVERFFKALPSTSWEVTAGSHFVLAQRDEQFPSGFNSSLVTFALRVGANYYFDLHREKKTTELPVP